MMVNCPCQTLKPTDSSNDELTRGEFLLLRNKCAALREILIPQIALKRFPATHVGSVCHDSIYYLAFRRGYLSRTTKAIHRYLIDNTTSKVRPDVNNYVNSLREKWHEVKNNNNVERCLHDRAKRYMGILIELLYAQYLENEGYEIKDLEAWENVNPTPKPDIRIEKHEELLIAVKHIGEDPDDFNNRSEGILGNCAHACYSDIYKPLNYLLFIICTAGAQLNGITMYQGKKIAAISIDALGWNSVDSGFDTGQIDFSRPAFTNCGSMGSLRRDIQKNIKGNKKKALNNDIFGNPDKYFKYIDEIWMYREEEFRFELKKKFVRTSC